MADNRTQSAIVNTPPTEVPAFTYSKKDIISLVINSREFNEAISGSGSGCDCVHATNSEIDALFN